MTDSPGELKGRLRGLITTMDALTLHTQGIEVFRGSHELFRRALLHAVDYIGGEEVERWEHILTGCDCETAQAVQRLEGGMEVSSAPMVAPVMAAPARSPMALRPLPRSAAVGALLGERAAAAARGTALAVAASSSSSPGACAVAAMAPPGSLRRRRPRQEQPGHPRGGGDAAVTVPVVQGRVPMVAGPARVAAAPHAVAQSPLLGAVPLPPQGAVLQEYLQEIGSEDDLPGVTKGRWLAMQQELRMKDFALQQLERQLGFERGCDEWFASECRSREHLREEHMRLLAGSLNSSMSGSQSRRAAADLASDVFGAADRRTEDIYLSRSAGWWHSEAQFIRTLHARVECQSTEDSVDMSEKDRMAYQAHLQPLLGGITKAFNLRRVQAQQFCADRVRALHQHQEEIMQRHVRTVMSCMDTSVGGSGRRRATQGGVGIAHATSSHTSESDNSCRDGVDGRRVARDPRRAEHTDSPDASAVDFCPDAFEWPEADEEDADIEDSDRSDSTSASIASGDAAAASTDEPVSERADTMSVLSAFRGASEWDSDAEGRGAPPL